MPEDGRKPDRRSLARSSDTPYTHASPGEGQHKMEPVGGIFATQWFHRRFTLAPDGAYTTVTELAGAARAPYDEIRKSLVQRMNGARELPRVILVAPPRHGDGATTTAVMLAANIAN